jgi:hypothetical protein
LAMRKEFLHISTDIKLHNKVEGKWLGRGIAEIMDRSRYITRNLGMCIASAGIG